MTPWTEQEPVASRRRSWGVAIAVVVVLALIAVLAVAAFVGLGLVRGPEPVSETDSGASRPPVVAPAPTHIRPELFAPPSEWDDEVG